MADLHSRVKALEKASGDMDPDVLGLALRVMLEDCYGPLCDSDEWRESAERAVAGFLSRQAARERALHVVEHGPG